MTPVRQSPFWLWGESLLGKTAALLTENMERLKANHALMSSLDNVIGLNGKRHKRQSQRDFDQQEASVPYHFSVIPICLSTSSVSSRSSSKFNGILYIHLHAMRFLFYYVLFFLQNENSLVRHSKCRMTQRAKARVIFLFVIIIHLLNMCANWSELARRIITPLVTSTWTVTKTIFVGRIGTRHRLSRMAKQ